VAAAKIGENQRRGGGGAGGGGSVASAAAKLNESGGRSKRESENIIGGIGGIRRNGVSMWRKQWRNL